MAKQVFLENHTLVVLTRFFNKNNIRKVVVRHGEDQKEFAEVVHAKWERYAELDMFPWKDAYRCTRCSRAIQITSSLGMTLEDYPYCHCGARMDGE